MAEKDFAVVDENNIVINVLKCNVETDQEAVDLCRNIVGNQNATVVETFKSAEDTKTSNTRYNYASVGDTWDSANNAFYVQKPHNSWVLNTNTFQWESPVGNPNPPDIADAYHIPTWKEDANRWEAWDAHNQTFTHYYDGTNWISLSD